MENLQITDWCHLFIRQQVKEGDLCIDATAGRGNDTLLLCELVGDKGKVISFDIQEEAIQSTTALLQEHKLEKRAKIKLVSHDFMDLYAKPDSVSCISFNFGYLPGGDHSITTMEETSLRAIKKGLDLLKVNGLMSLCIYSGQDSGFSEKKAILDYVKNLNSKQYLVIVSQYYNRSNNPPIPVLIIKLCK